MSGFTQNDGTGLTAQAANNTPIAAGTVADTTIKTSYGHLVRILVTAAGTANMLFYDNPSGHTGAVIGIVKSSAVVGDIVDCQAPAMNGITCQGSANNAGVTVFWS